MSLPRRLWERRRERPLLVALAVLTVLAMLAWPALDFVLRGAGISVTKYDFYDLGAYGHAVELWQDGIVMYWRGEGGGFRGSFLYPPITVLFFYPFTFVESFDVAGTLLGGFSLVLLWVGVEVVARELGYDLAVWERFVLLFALFGFQPALYDFKMGQIGTLLAAVLCFAFYAHERQRETGLARWAYLSGLFTTLAPTFKLHFATAGAHLLRDRRRFLGAVGAALALVVASFAIFGVVAHEVYLEVLAWGKGWEAAPRDPRLWGPAYYKPFYIFGSSGIYVRLAGVLGVIGLTLAARDGPADRETFALGVASVPLFAPVAYTFDLVVLLVPALILLATELDREGGRPAIPVLAVFLVHVHAYGLRLLTDPPSWVPLREPILSNLGLLQPGVWGTLLLVGLAAVRVAEDAQVPAAAADRVAAVRSD